MKTTNDRVWMAIAFALTLALSMSLVLGYQGESATAVAAPDPGDGAESEDAAAEVVEVSLSEFSISPAEITAPAGVPLQFAVTNAGAGDVQGPVHGRRS